MLWLAPLPWARWTLVGLVIALAAWLELKPDPTVEVPFAIEAIDPGEVLTSGLVEMRRLPDGILAGASLGDITSRPVLAGEPILETHVDDTLGVVPTGWWVVPVALPEGAHVGDPVRLVLLDSGTEVEGVVAHPGSDDPFAASDGGVAVPPELASEAAVASANARLAVLISSR